MIKFDLDKTYVRGQETLFQKTLQKYILYKQPHAFVIKLVGGIYQKVGVPDLWIVHKGHLICIETKVGNNKPSKQQRAVMKQLKRAGATVGVAYNLREAISILKESNAK